MAQLIVRNLEDEVVRALRARAARHGRSTEAEHRELLRETLLGRPRQGFKELLASMPEIPESELRRRRDRPRKVRL